RLSVGLGLVSGLRRLILLLAGFLELSQALAHDLGQGRQALGAEQQEHQHQEDDQLGQMAGKTEHGERSLAHSTPASSSSGSSFAPAAGPSARSEARSSLGISRRSLTICISGVRDLVAPPMSTPPT